MGKRKGNDLIELDGRTLEGGGQLIRIAYCLSALTRIPVKVENIRGNRSGGGGLKAQHLACVQWLGRATNAQLSGAGKGSKTLLFTPEKATSEPSPAFTKKTLPNGQQVYECRLDIGTAGSTGLALQAILPFILFSPLPSQLPIHLRLSGGTNVSGSPSFEYIKHVLLPTLSRIGFPEITATLGKRGWSHGGASIGNFTLEIPPRASAVLPAFKYRPSNTTSSTPSNPSSLRAIFIAPISCHQHFTNSLKKYINIHFTSAHFPLGQGNLAVQHEDSQNDKRMYLILIAKIPHSEAPQGSYILARDWLYDKRIRNHDEAAAEMADSVTKDLVQEWKSGGWVDEHMRDQLVIFQALAKGRSEVFPGVDEDGEEREPSLHARTAEWVSKQILGVKFDSEGSCEGVAYGDEDEGTTGRLAGDVEKLQV
ncbi:RNA 3'-terminal phosphate cyclase [Pseudocercospora fuligena]|uniref:RNA 3'-terminal phosphate cyclase n=1 Tax=Pseudocercospora fuligena TaxID=685502 RepID=A0A8H6RUM1_9PEZI|nr:RNA 3'-terminal phosphate cyclase [Pseudocercospora fuligena]